MDSTIANGLVDSFTSAYGSMKTASTSCIVFMIVMFVLNSKEIGEGTSPMEYLYINKLIH